MLETTIYVGAYFYAKWQTRLVAAGGDYRRVAAQMRKQGIPLEISLKLLGLR